MKQTGIFNAGYGAEAFGFRDLAGLHWNHQAPQLYAEAIRRNEAVIAQGGALVAETGVHTGRSPKDKAIVRDATTENSVWWEGNNAMSREHFDVLLADFIAHAEGRELFVQDLYAGADPEARVRARVFTEFAWHSLFIRDLLIRPQRSALADFVPDLTIVDLPSFRADPRRHGCRSETVIACDFTRRIVLIGGTRYAGEMKKSVFTYLNFILPDVDVLPMHCSANFGEPDDVAIFFGLSGTGKTTLSAVPGRTLIGDDEHGWSREGVFNFEGGCYAKAIRLSREMEPEIYAASEHFGAVMENVVLDPSTGAPDFDDDSRTENTRIAYPLDFIAHASTTGRAGLPRNVIMLACDAFGVLPPIAKLDPDQAVYHFLSGYTAKVAGTERGVIEPQATFSTCFGAPFMPRHPIVYGNLLRDLVRSGEVHCWLVNTGWSGGPCGVGARMPIRVSRRLVAAALDGSLAHAEFRRDRYFGLAVPDAVPGVDPALLDPIRTWRDPSAFAEMAERLVDMFHDNFAQYADRVDPAVIAAGPGSTRPATVAKRDWRAAHPRPARDSRSITRSK